VQNTRANAVPSSTDFAEVRWLRAYMNSLQNITLRSSQLCVEAIYTPVVLCYVGANECPKPSPNWQLGHVPLSSTYVCIVDCPDRSHGHRKKFPYPHRLMRRREASGCRSKPAYRTRFRVIYTSALTMVSIASVAICGDSDS
jgi:hypothetical protein